MKNKYTALIASLVLSFVGTYVGNFIPHIYNNTNNVSNEINFSELTKDEIESNVEISRQRGELYKGFTEAALAQEKIKENNGSYKSGNFDDVKVTVASNDGEYYLSEMTLDDDVFYSGSEFGFGEWSESPDSPR